MQAVGPGALSTGELLAILLRTGTKEESALELANRLLGNPDGVRFLVEASLEELCKVKGVGLAKATQIKAAIEFGRRISCMGSTWRPKISCPEDVSSLIMEEMCYLDREHFKVILLNTKNQVLAVETISVGSLSSSLVHPREVFKKAIQRSAAAIILVHNHPSGDPTPSNEDLEVTKRLREAGKILGIEVLDHIIIGDHRFVSMKEMAYL
ncbi:MAG: DNA repair protein RadC [Thermoanaerobacterales bacterium 50_218]|nr:MAG: DNA repair protein RadC [Thermoanaerobacterales bacterium 50_218]HAA90786.1 hypothetical protein [Peptococcaceae bacterium]